MGGQCGMVIGVPMKFPGHAQIATMAQSGRRRRPDLGADALHLLP